MGEIGGRGDQSGREAQGGGSRHGRDGRFLKESRWKGTACLACVEPWRQIVPRGIWSLRVEA